MQCSMAPYVSGVSIYTSGLVFGVFRREYIGMYICELYLCVCVRTCTPNRSMYF